MVAKAVEIHGKHINLGDKVKVKYEGKEIIGVLSHILSESHIAVYIEELDCIKVFDVFRIQEIIVLETKGGSRRKTVKFHEMEKGKYYYSQRSKDEKYKIFYKVNSSGNISRTIECWLCPDEEQFDGLNQVPLNVKSNEVNFIEWEEPFQPTGEDWERLKDFITDKDPESYRGGSQLIYEILQEIERIEKKEE